MLFDGLVTASTAPQGPSIASAPTSELPTPRARPSAACVEGSIHRRCLSLGWDSSSVRMRSLRELWLARYRRRISLCAACGLTCPFVRAGAVGVADVAVAGSLAAAAAAARASALALFVLRGGGWSGSTVRPCTRRTRTLSSRTPIEASVVVGLRLSPRSSAPSRKKRWRVDDAMPVFFSTFALSSATVPLGLTCGLRREAFAAPRRR